jgi:hypothetical protein
MTDRSKHLKENLMCLHHHVYLLRLWQTEEAGTPEWRASLEIPKTGERIGFASMEQLFAFLMDLGESNNEQQLSRS